MTTEVKAAIDQLPEEVREAMGQGLKLRLSALKKLHKDLEKAGIPTDVVDEEMELISGTKEKTGLLTVMGVVDDSEKPDPLQEDLPLDKDTRTWSRTKDQVVELISEIIQESVPARAVMSLNALEDGERDRELGPRKNVLDAIRAARAPLAEKVNRLRVLDGDAH